MYNVINQQITIGLTKCSYYELFLVSCILNDSTLQHPNEGSYKTAQRGAQKHLRVKQMEGFKIKVFWRRHNHLSKSKSSGPLRRLTVPMLQTRRWKTARCFSHALMAELKEMASVESFSKSL